MTRLLVSQPLRAGISEADFTTTVINHAKVAGWLVHHDRPAQKRSGAWATSIQGGAGFPDLVLIDDAGRQVVAELKVGRSRPTAEQLEWLNRYAKSGTPTFLWKPEHWLTAIVPVLNGDTSVTPGRWES